MAGKPGQGCKYTRKAADAICKRLGEGESLASIARTKGMPARTTILNWVSNDVDGFADKYARARDAGLDVVADDVLRIADDVSGDSQRDRLRVDARKWYLSKIAPKRYGDKVTTELTGPNGGAVQVERVERVIVDPADTDS